MAMGRQKAKQNELWVSTDEIPRAASHPFYAKVSEVLKESKFDAKAEQLCERFYKPVKGRPSIGCLKLNDRFRRCLPSIC